MERYEKGVVCQLKGRIVGCALLRKLPPDANDDYADRCRIPCVYFEGKKRLLQIVELKERARGGREQNWNDTLNACVYRDYRNQGIGSEVMQAAIAEWRNEPSLSTDEAEDIVLWIDHKQKRCDLLRFYERLNFKVALDRGADSKLILSS